MVRKIIEIDERKCNGCGLCVQACREGAIEMIEGKAKLMRDDYCDGLGNCLPACPAGAISFIEREAAPFDEQAVRAGEKKHKTSHTLECGCPGTHSKLIERADDSAKAMNDFAATAGSFSAAPVSVPSGSGITDSGSGSSRPDASEQSARKSRNTSMLRQWPVQIKLVPVNAPYFDNADLLIAADCTAYAYADFHADFMRNKITLIGCPKLDDTDYTEKLTEILRRNTIKSITVVRMEVPCCAGIEHAVKKALKAAAAEDENKFIPWQVVTVSTDGRILPQ